MGLRAYVGAVIGFVIGFLLSQWFVRGAPPSEVLTTMQLICACVGALGGLLAGVASEAGNQGRAAIAGAGGLAGCFLVGLAIWIYRWIFL